MVDYESNMQQTQLHISTKEPHMPAKEDPFHLCPMIVRLVIYVCWSADSPLLGGIHVSTTVNFCSRAKGGGRVRQRTRAEDYERARTL